LAVCGQQADKEANMIEIKRILFPIDFSEYADKVLPYVLFFAGKHNAAIYLLHVVQDLRHYAYGGPGSPQHEVSRLMEELVESGEKIMEKICREHFDAYPDFHRRVIVGEPGEVIVKMVNEEKIDLVVMGTHGRKGLSRTLFGSVAEYVVRNAPAPVVTINPYVRDTN
jgi:nucleotide-binding universal stress UspA family protein